MRRLVCCLLLAAASLPGQIPELVSVEKIWDAGAHNAFTDLIRFQDRWFCTFREGDGHVSENGDIRVLVSGDGETWESAALLTESGIDLRDPKLSITPDGCLMILAGGTRWQGKKYLGKQPRVFFSSNGREWTRPQPILDEGDWLWRITWHKGRGYGVSYRGGGGDRAMRGASLYATTDGVQYESITDLDVPGAAEVTLRFLPNDEMMALVRREYDTRRGWIGVSKPPYKEWSWKEIAHRLGGPNFIRLPNGQLWAGSRLYGEESKTALARMSRDAYEPVLTLPSGGDTSYPGLVWHDNLLWMSYYSSHEGKTSIYLAKIRINPAARVRISSPKIKIGPPQ